MEVLREPRISPALSLPQEVPVDLTKGSLRGHDSLIHSYGFEATLNEAVFPHLRLNGRVTSVVRRGESYPVAQNTTDTDSATRSVELEAQSHRGLTPLPKKRRILDAELPPDPQIDKRRKMEVCDVQLESNRTLTPPYSKEVYYPPHSRSFCEPYKERPEDLFHFSPPTMGYPMPPTYGMDNASLMDRIMNTQYIDASHESIKETESLLAAVQHSQMLYYTYCTQLLQNLQTRRLIQEQHHIKKCSELQTKSQDQELKNEMLRDVRVKETLPREEPQNQQLKTHPREEKRVPATTSVSTPPEDPSSLPSAVGSSPVSPSQDWFLRPSPLESGAFEHGTENFNNLHGRKRAPRALTGKHVRPGTGASPSTLLTLRQKVAERLKTKDGGHTEENMASGAKIGRSTRGKKR